MKQLIFTIAILLTFTLGLKSQNYVPFPTENVNWNVYYVGTCEESDPDTLVLRYSIHGDTTINETDYHKLCLESGDTINPVITGIGGIREEDKRIYYIGSTILFDNYYESLLYDFTKQIGDTIKHDAQGSFYSVVLDIDSILIDGTFRKRYKVHISGFYQDPDYWVEGIGSIKNGLLGHISDVPTCGSHYWESICFKEHGKLLYLNPSFNDCFPDGLLMDMNLTKTDGQIKIYPNPMGQNLLIENNSNEKLSVKIMDINGRSVLEQPLDKLKTELKLNAAPGIYNILVTNNAGKIVVSKKIIKQ